MIDNNGGEGGNAARKRLAAAERVCYLYGISSAGAETEREKATLQAWMDWSAEFGGTASEIADEEVAALARRRDEIRSATLARFTGRSDG